MRVRHTNTGFSLIMILTDTNNHRPGANIKSASPRATKLIEGYKRFDYSHNDRFTDDMKLYVRKE